MGFGSRLGLIFEKTLGVGFGLGLALGLRGNLPQGQLSCNLPDPYLFNI